jgi:hypothetical protein
MVACELEHHHALWGSAGHRRRHMVGVASESQVCAVITPHNTGSGTHQGSNEDAQGSGGKSECASARWLHMKNTSTWMVICLSWIMTPESMQDCCPICLHEPVQSSDICLAVCAMVMLWMYKEGHQYVVHTTRSSQEDVEGAAQ